MVYCRIHEGWPLTKALDTPRIHRRQESGQIYKVTRLSTLEMYVGLTSVSVADRWTQHLRTAGRKRSPLACAIQEDGPDGFLVELLERDVPMDRLAERERHWIGRLGTLWPAGLNRHHGGALGGGGQREVAYADETFQSVAAAAAALAERHQLTEAAAHQRLRQGKSLETPLKIFRTRGRGVAGSFLWSRWRAMRNNSTSTLCEEWQEWDRFAVDLASLRKTDRLVRLDRTKPWGPGNFKIHADSYVDHPKVGSAHWARWRAMLKNADRPGKRGVVEEWRDFDRFEADISPSYTESAVIIPVRWNEPWGPDNFRWGTQAELSQLIGTHGHKRAKHGQHRTRTYKRWASMRNDARRKGQSVAADWHDYANFRTAVGDGIECGLILIRPNRSLPFGPDNFRLVTRDEYRGTLHVTHGQSRTPIHRRWLAMRSRALSSAVGWDPRWDDFKAFVADVGDDRPGCNLERADASRPYGPDNFLWVDRRARRRDVEARRAAKREEGDRRRQERAVTVRGVKYRGLYALAEAYGVPRSTVCLRVRAGMTAEQAATAPNQNQARAVPVRLDGRDFPSMNAALRYVEKRYGIRRNTMALRMKSGLSLEAAAHKPLRATVLSRKKNASN